jgi:hypothetical protein
MNPNSGEAPKFELSQAPSSDPEAVKGIKGSEVLPAPESAVGKRPPPAKVQLPVNDTPASGPVPITPPPVSHSSSDDSSDALTAAEIDRIEKEWVDKAKSIVAKTRDDPHLQNTAMSKVKADYIKKRFNKTIPTDDTVAA